jgi:hypothetical protein
MLMLMAVIVIVIVNWSTGGVQEEFNLKYLHEISTAELWYIIENSYAKGSILGCSINVRKIFNNIILLIQVI